MAIEIKAPHPTDHIDPEIPTIFLAGSIAKGGEVRWQDIIKKELQYRNVVIYNPHRADWDASWVQDISNPKFNEQVTWEMDHMDKCDLMVVYFDPAGQAPITLMEVGLHAGITRMVVCCPEGYWRRGNVQMVCDRYGIPLMESIDQLIAFVTEQIGKTSK